MFTWYAAVVKGVYSSSSWQPTHMESNTTMWRARDKEDTSMAMKRSFVLHCPAIKTPCPAIKTPCRLPCRRKNERSKPEKFQQAMKAQEKQNPHTLHAISLPATILHSSYITVLYYEVLLLLSHNNLSNKE